MKGVMGFTYANTNVPFMSEKVSRSAREHLRVLSDTVSIAHGVQQKFVFLCLREENAQTNWLDIQMTREEAMRLIELLQMAVADE